VKLICIFIDLKQKAMLFDKNYLRDPFENLRQAVQPFPQWKLTLNNNRNLARIKSLIKK